MIGRDVVLRAQPFLRVIRYFLVLFSFVGMLCATLGLAADASVSIQVDRREVAVGESFRLIITLTNAGSEAITPTLPDAFEIRGQSSQSSMSMIMGQGASMTVSQTLSLLATKVGKFTIGPVAVKSKSGNLQSNSIEVTVRNGGSRAASQAVFLTAQVSNPTPWEHERFELILKFHFRSQISNPKLEEGDLAAFDVFNLKETRQTESVVEINGSQYQVVEIRKTISARKAGMITIPPARIGVDVRQERSRKGPNVDPDNPFAAFDDPFANPFFGGGMEHILVSSQSIELNVKALPEPKPEHWTQAVGSLSLKQECSKTALAVGESATLTLTFSGQADLSSLMLPADLVVAGAKIYPDKPILERTQGPDGRIVDTRSFKIGIVPTQAGNIEIPAIVFSYFDVSKGTFSDLRTSIQTLNVTGSAEETGRAELSGTPSGSVPKSEVQMRGDDILPLKEDLAALALDARVSPQRMAFWFLVPGLLGLVWVALLIRDRVLAVSEETRPETRFRKAFALWNQHYKRLIAKRSGIHEADLSSVYGEVGRYLKDYVGGRTNVLAGALTPIEVAELLSGHVSTECMNEVRQILERVEMAQFVSASVSPSGLEELLKAANAAVTRAQKEWHR